MPPQTAGQMIGADFFPPVKQGDVYRLAQRAPRVIGIVDGYFEQVPAVWHKEILWAMCHGIHVFGASSMGALRAAELWQFGMVGVGTIFEAYRDGVLIDDDEVALRHGPAEAGYLALSEPMVNIRATLKHARNEGVISEDTRAELERRAKGLFYPERVYPTILNIGRDAGLPDADLTALSRWLPANRIDQKREDALEMLRRIEAFVSTDPPPKSVSYCFQHTDMWEMVVRSEVQFA